MKLGDGIGMWLVLAWLAIEVGPWWYAAVILGVGFAGNLVHDRLAPRAQAGLTLPGEGRG